MAWLILVSILAVSAASAAAYAWTRPADCPGPRAPDAQFRFDDVYVVEQLVEGNWTTFRVSTWYSNIGKAPLGNLRFVVYAVDNNRNVATQVGQLDAGTLAGRLSRNATLEFRLNNTFSYRLEILVFVDDFLTAEGSGSIGFVEYWSDTYLVRAAKTDQFDYQYYIAAR